MAKAVRCLNCGQMSGMHSFPAYHCPDHAHKGKFLADQTMRSDIGIPLRKRLLDALGWQGGTVADALAEVRRLRAKAEDPLKGLALNQALADWWPLDRPVRLDDMERLEGVLRDLFDVPPKPLGQGVAALLPEHGEVKP